MYKSFLAEKNLQQVLKKIPQPSDTRWLFYRDVVTSIMSQRKYLEGFVKGQRSFTGFWNTLRSKNDARGVIFDGDFSLKSGPLSRLFHFVKFVLDILGKVNTFLQQHNLNVWDAWCVVNSLKKHLICLVPIFQQPQLPQSLTFLSGLEREQISDYESCIQQLVMSMNIRLSCPSKSFDTRKGRFNTTSVSFCEEHEDNPFSQRCSVSNMFDLLCLQPPVDGRSNVFLLQRPDLAAEVKRVEEEIKERHEWETHSNEIVSSISSQVGFEVTRRRSLQDIFLFVEKRRYPLLWKEIVKLRTVMPTTVCCEQSFSV